jgi:hypothetical protein
MNRFYHVVCVVLVLGNAVLASYLLLGWPALGPEHVKLDYEHTGVQVGQQMREFPVVDLANTPVSLSTLWRDRPCVLMTGSLTCPVSRDRAADFAAMADRFGESINVAMLYVVEAHPDESPSPYSETVWVTRRNLDDAVLHPQPSSVNERVQLAKAFASGLSASTTVVVDEMSNFAWGFLGAGPNVALLIDRDGKVLARQGWYAPAAMVDAVQQHTEP